MIAFAICFGLVLIPKPQALNTLFLNPITVIGGGAIIAGIISGVSWVVQTKLNELNNWRYVRSFEDVVSSRPPEGVV